MLLLKPDETNCVRRYKWIRFRCLLNKIFHVAAKALPRAQANPSKFPFFHAILSATSREKFHGTPLLIEWLYVVLSSRAERWQRTHSSMCLLHHLHILGRYGAGAEAVEIVSTGTEQHRHSPSVALRSHPRITNVENQDICRANFVELIHLRRYFFLQNQRGNSLDVAALQIGDCRGPLSRSYLDSFRQQFYSNIVHDHHILRRRDIPLDSPLHQIHQICVC